MVRDGFLSSLRTTSCRTAFAAVVAALVVAAPPAFAADQAFVGVDLPADTAPAGIALGHDGALWFTAPGPGSIGRLDASGVAWFALEDASSGPGAIVAGPDDALWFVLTDGNAIGRLTPAGGFDTYPLPADGSSPAGITVGPDGALWFTERFGDRIGRIDPTTGTIEERDLPASSGPTAITAGPDGAVWFTEQWADGLGRIDPSTGDVSRVALPVGSGPTGVAAADGALWVTLRATNQIARVTPGGDVITFPIPTGASRPTEIVADTTHGVLWFIEEAASQVARLSYAGTIQEFAAESQSGLAGIAVDGSGRPWFTEGRLDRIGMLDLPATPPDTTAPTIAITSPGAGAWTVRGSGALEASYTCADEGGSGLATCDGKVADGAPLPDAALGLATLDVHAADGAGNTADASAPYLVFGSVSGSVVAPSAARPGEGLTLELGMELPVRADALANAITHRVACSDGTRLGADEPADIRSRVTHLGELSLRWDTSRTWGSECRALSLRFSAPGWTGAHALFGPVAFTASAKR